MKKWDKQKRNIVVTALVTICVCFLTFYSVFASGQSKPTVTVTGVPASSGYGLDDRRESTGTSVVSSAMDTASSLQSEEPDAASQKPRGVPSESKHKAARKFFPAKTGREFVLSRGFLFPAGLFCPAGRVFRLRAG